MTDMTAGIVLAGGRGRRMGRDKASIVLGGRTLLERTVSALAQIADEVIVVRARGQSLPALLSETRVIEDALPRRGPAAGLHAGLSCIGEAVGLAVACDLPFLDASLLRELLSLAPGYDAVVPVVKGRPQTLHAVYARSCLPVLERLLAERDASLQALVAQVKTRYVECQNDAAWLRSCLNINTPADLERAVQMASEVKK